VELGAPLYVYGLLSALPALAGAIQVPAAYLIETYRRRKRVALAGFVGTRLFILLLVLVPVLFTDELAIALLLVAVLLQSVTSAVSGSAWNSIIRDLLPQDGMGAFFSRRHKLTVALSIPLSLGAGWFVTWWAETNPDSVLEGYSALFAVGLLAGLGSLYFVSRTPEPAMPAVTGPVEFRELVARPFRDPDFRTLMWFLGAWTFAMGIATPFFTVYLLRRLGFDMAFVVTLTVLSQFADVAFSRIWGTLADRFSSKAVLRVSGPLVLASTLLWLFTGTPELHRFTVPLLVGIHVLRGVSMAGVTMATGSIAMRLAPAGRATPYLAANSLVGALAGGVAPLIGGAVAGLFEFYRFTVTLELAGPGGGFSVPAFYLQGMDFAFVLAFLVGIYAMHRLTFVAEADVGRVIVVQHLLAEMRRPMRSFSGFDDVVELLYVPLGAIRRVRRRRPAEESDDDDR